MYARINIFICSALLLLTAACSKVLDKRDRGSLQGDLVFGDSLLARSYLDYLYDQNLPGWGGTWGSVSNYTDESFGESKYLEGSLTVSDVGDFGTKLDNNNNWGKIRAINLFLEEIDKGTLTPTWKATLKAQACFLRAWRYFELVKLYGGVPIILKQQNTVGEEAKEEAFVARNKTSECIAQIVSDLDAAAAGLPARWPTTGDWGRVTSAAAAALKGRVLLYWASPEFNPANLADRWEAAYTACKAAKTLLSSNGYKLHSSFSQMWFEEVNNPEAVFVTGYNNATGDQISKNNGYDNSTRPAINGTGGGSNQPSKELIESFPMKDGRKISNSSEKYPYDSVLFYKNRDPRFDMTIAYNGVNWPLNGQSGYKVWTYFVGNTTAEQGKASNTGFYCRKAIDPRPGTGEVRYIGTDWMEIRYAEVLLNLAEAANGANRPAEAYDELKAIRQRAGIEPGDDGMYGLTQGQSRADLFNTILDERLYEFAFEGKRFWDLRRYKLFESKLNGKRRTGLILRLNTDLISGPQFLAQRDTINLDRAYQTYFKREIKIMDTKYAVNWRLEYYIFPIPKAALDNNPMLIQNNTWGGGFDPVQ